MKILKICHLVMKIEVEKMVEIIIIILLINEMKC
jgi:hypothetical protein